MPALLLQGRVAAQGTYQEVQRHPAVAELLAEFNSSGGAEPAGRTESASSGADADDDASDTPEVPQLSCQCAVTCALCSIVLQTMLRPTAGVVYPDSHETPRKRMRQYQHLASSDAARH
jgi:hypothetical protein